MKPCNYVIIEDVATNRTAAITELDKKRFVLKLEITTKAEALSQIADFADLNIELVILDCNLEPNQDSGDDGREIADTIRSFYPELPIVVWSARTNYSWTDGLVQAVVKKNRYDVQPLLDTIDAIK